MIQIPLSQVKDDLSRYLRMAEKEDVIITRHGIPAGVLIGFEDPEAWWEELLLRAGQGISIERLREKHNIKPEAARVEE